MLLVSVRMQNWFRTYHRLNMSKVALRPARCRDANSRVGARNNELVQSAATAAWIAVAMP